MKKRFLAAAIAASTMAMASGAGASLVFSGSGTNSITGQCLGASAAFSVVGGNLQVVLSNTGCDVLAPSDVLTALFFDVAGVGPLTPVSALLTAGSTVLFGPANGGDVGGEWAYGAGLAGAPGGATKGISSSGFGLFGSGNFPPTFANLGGPVAVDGVQYGITSALDSPVTGNAAVTGGNALIQNSVTFLLSGIPGGFNPSATNITHVSFQYGTALDEPNTSSGGPSSTGNGIPEPSSTSLAFLGIAILGATLWSRRRSMQS